MSVRVYYLETETIDGTQRVQGESIIKNAILQVEDDKRKLIMDTTTAQHNALKALASISRTAYPEESRLLQEREFPTPGKSFLDDIAELKARVTTIEATASTKVE